MPLFLHTRFKNEQLVDPQTLEYGPMLTLTAVDTADAGLYSCRINNDVDEVESEIALLNIQGKMEMANNVMHKN